MSVPLLSIPMKSLFTERQVCGADLGAEKPVYVLGYRDGSNILFQNAPEMPGSCDIACALPGRTSIVRRLKSPFSSLKKTRRILPSLLDVQMPFSIEDCATAFTQLAPGEEGKIEAVAAAARKTDIQAYLDSIAERGIDPVYLDAEGLAMWHGSIHEVPPERNECRAVVKLEKEGAALCFGIGSRILGSHAVSALEAGTVRRLLSASFDPPARVNFFLTGSRAELPSSKDAIEAIGTEWVRAIRTHDKPGEFLARALARRAILGGSHGVNLRRDEMAHAGGTAAERSRSLALSGVLAACGLFLAGAALTLNAVAGARLRGIEDEFTSGASQVSQGRLGGASGIHALQVAEKAVEKRLAAAEPLLAPFQPSLLVRVREIAAKSGEYGLVLEEARINASQAELKGRAASWSLPEKLTSFLRQQGLVVDLKREESLVDESVRFVITAEGRI